MALYIGTFIGEGLLPTYGLRGLPYDDPARRDAYDCGIPRGMRDGCIVTLHALSTRWYYDGCDDRNASDFADSLRGLGEFAARELERFADGSSDWKPARIVVDRYGGTVVSLHRSVL